MEKPDEEIDLEELLGWAEFCSWSALVMALIIYWLQGPSVSPDQYVVRTALVVISGLGALSLRGRVLIHRWRSRSEKSAQDV
jgi:hypothetical protein